VFGDGMGNFTARKILSVNVAQSKKKLVTDPRSPYTKLCHVFYFRFMSSKRESNFCKS
jgi:hypothetical protein